MVFMVKHLTQRASGRSLYIESEHSLYYEPWNDTNYSIQVGNSGVGLDVRSDTMTAVQFTGYLPKQKWVTAVLSPPEGRPGELTVKDVTPHTVSGIGIVYAEEWDTFHDTNSGWICIGSTAHDQTMDTVEFARDTIAVVDDGRLTAIWIRPQYVA